MRVRMLAVLPVLLLSPLTTVPLGGCVECYMVDCAPCPAPIAVTVRPLAGTLAVDDVEVTATKDGLAAWVSCVVSAVDVHCDVDDRGGAAVGSYLIVASAPGWRSETRTFTVGPVERIGCCHCGYDQTQAIFELRAEQP